MKGSDRIATLALLLAVAGVVVLKLIQLDLSIEIIGALAIVATIALVIYFRSKGSRGSRGKRRMN